MAPVETYLYLYQLRSLRETSDNSRLVISLLSVHDSPSLLLTLELPCALGSLYLNPCVSMACFGNCV